MRPISLFILALTLRAQTVVVTGTLNPSLLKKPTAPSPSSTISRKKAPFWEASINRGELGYAYGRAGRREDAEKLAASTAEINPFNHARVFAGLGDKDRTLEALDRAAKVGPIRIGRTLSFPEMSFLRGDRRVKVLRKKVGLPE